MLTSEKLKECDIKLGASGCGIANIEFFSDVPKGFSPTDVYSRCKSVAVVIKQMSTGAIFAENPILYTHAAVNAGLGIMGHNTLFISPIYGNMVYIGSILVDAELEQDDLVKDFSCLPNCHKCMIYVLSTLLKTGRLIKNCVEKGLF